MYPKNAWYVACTPDEIAEKPLGRTICGEKIVFYRPAPDQVAALDDFCPHRGAPLSLGTVCEGHLQCGYHGLRVECTGKSVSMPGQRVQGFPKARSFPVVERYGFIWVWPGDADKADPATIHHLPWANNPEWAYGGGLYHIACDYRLMIDNLMDLTHETYVHSTSIGQKEIDEVPCKTRVEGDEVITSRFMEGIQPPPFWQMALRMNGLPDDQPVDRWQICHFTPPSHVLIEVGVALAGHGGYNARPTRRRRASWWTSSRPRRTPPSTTSGAWRATSSHRTRRSPPRSATARARFLPKTSRCWNCSSKTCCVTPTASCSCSTSTQAACSRARSWTASWRPSRPPHPRR